MANFISQVTNFFNGFWFWLDERSNNQPQTDRQTNSLTPYVGVSGLFLSVKFATFLLALLAGSKLFFTFLDTFVTAFNNPDKLTNDLEQAKCNNPKADSLQITSNQLTKFDPNYLRTHTICRRYEICHTNLTST